MTWQEEIDKQVKIEARAEEQFEKFKASLLLADFKILSHFELTNGYHGWSREIACPWYLFKTDLGLIKIGWRKRVINVDWQSTALRWKRPTDPDVTASDTYFHAYGYEKLIEYLKLLSTALKELYK